MAAPALFAVLCFLTLSDARTVRASVRFEQPSRHDPVLSRSVAKPRASVSFQSVQAVTAGRFVTVGIIRDPVIIGGSCTTGRELANEIALSVQYFPAAALTPDLGRVGVAAVFPTRAQAVAPSRPSRQGTGPMANLRRTVRKDVLASYPG